jgi:hypothetical protein
VQAAATAQQAQYDACLAANRVRAADLKRWQAVVALIPPDNPRTAAFDTRVAALNVAADQPERCVLSPTKRR